MNKDGVIIVFDKMTLSKMRIKNIFEVQGMSVENVNNQIELVNVLARVKTTNAVLIMTIDDEISDDGLELVRKIKPMYRDLHIIILTSIMKRDFFSKCIAEGVSDYLLKPFEEYVLFERATRLLNSKNAVHESILKFNFNSYLNSEIIKARKGNYYFALLKCKVFNLDEGGYSSPDVDYPRYAAHIYEELNSLFWETDIFIQYGGDSFLGFFPFCGAENSFIINEKLTKKFDSMKEQYYIYKKYNLINAFVTYPTDGDNVDSLFELLDKKIDEIVEA
jgi:CheY-like chemotaxis protein